MSARVTKDTLDSALAYYGSAVKAAGFPHDLDRLTLGAPYGSVMHVYRTDEAGRPVHDLPGFAGVGAGLLTKHQALDALLVAARTLFAVADLHGPAATPTPTQEKDGSND